jgi:Homeodomain
LFKERQRNKDSPYNFNNPPSTTLNLEEYERTGQTKVTQLVDNSESSNQSINQHHHLAMAMAAAAAAGAQNDNRPVSQPSSIASSNDRHEQIQIKPEPDEINDMDLSISSKSEQEQEQFYQNHLVQQQLHQHQQQQQQNQQSLGAQQMLYNNFDNKSESGSSEMGLSRPQTPNSVYNSGMNDLLNQQIDSIPINNISNLTNLNSMGPPKKFQLNKMFDKAYETNSNSSNSSTSSGKRANRTRFTDYQIKVLQEFFENNSYPKDSDLEYLSKLLLLSPRVIVVWFQVSSYF